MNPLKFGIVILALGGAFWLGDRRGERHESAYWTQRWHEVAEATRRAEHQEIDDDTAQINHAMAAATMIAPHKREAGDPNDVGRQAINDCRGALAAMNLMTKMDRRRGLEAEPEALPTSSIRFWGYDGNIVSYRMPPPIKLNTPFDPDAKYKADGTEP